MDNFILFKCQEQINYTCIVKKKANISVSVFNFIPLNKDILFFIIHYFRLLANKSKPYLRLADVMKTFIKKKKCNI